MMLAPRMGVAWPEAPQREKVGVDAAVLAAGHSSWCDLLSTPRFLRAVQGIGSVEVSAGDGYRAVVIGAAAELRAREHRVVDIAEFASAGFEFLPSR